jgi:hypothetical protein
MIRGQQLNTPREVAIKREHTTFPPVSRLIPDIELSSEATPRDDSTLETGAGAKAAAEPARMVMAAMDFMLTWVKIF